MDQAKISDTLSQDRIQWFFNPPSAPHFGGVWERLVKSAKKALKITLNGQLVNDETLLTLMAENESLLNSRPLTHVSVDPQDLEAITPNYFLISLHDRRFMSQARRTRYFAQSAIRARSARRGEEKNKAPVRSPLFLMFRQCSTVHQVDSHADWSISTT